MKILWVCPFFLHPTDRGAQIRTLGTLKQLHKRHQIHFAALNDPRNTEGPRRASEYSSFQISVPHSAPDRQSLAIVPQLAASILSPVPLAVSRYASKPLRRQIDALIAAEHYDSIVCDFLAAAPNLSDLGSCVLFQHNVETTIWQRHVQQAGSPLRKAFFRMQANKMEAYEKDVCKKSRHIIAVSGIDARRMKTMFGIENVTSVPTGVDVEYFAPPERATPTSDIVFCGSMDWLPNVDAIEHFLSEILPLIREKIPGATFTIAGRSPDARVLKAVQGLSGVSVTGKVDDMRPYLWGAKISVVPIRIGGGTRLKIYECMAAGLPVVSTTVGAEGLSYSNGSDIAIADNPPAFADACIRLLSQDDTRRSIAANALERAQSKLSWQAVSYKFEAILEQNTL
jgi:glycosyltransferase involved in cell wall biosynthesis